jgi:hypothetical protein
MIAYEMFAELFRRRLDGDDIKAARALEQNFANPKSEMEQRIKADIDAYRWAARFVRTSPALPAGLARRIDSTRRGVRRSQTGSWVARYPVS